MAHLFKQIYSDDILNFKEQFTRDELTRVIERKMQRIVRKHTLSSNIEKTNTFKHSIDYRLCIYRLKYNTNSPCTCNAQKK